MSDNRVIKPEELKLGMRVCRLDEKGNRAQELMVRPHELSMYRGLVYADSLFEVMKEACEHGYWDEWGGGECKDCKIKKMQSEMDRLTPKRYTIEEFLEKPVEGPCWVKLKNGGWIISRGYKANRRHCHMNPKHVTHVELITRPEDADES